MWFYCDDNSVTEATLNSIKTSHIVFLLYEKLPLKDASAALLRLYETSNPAKTLLDEIGNFVCFLHHLPVYKLKLYIHSNNEAPL